ncbi:AraC family transcriptional regulator [Nostoc sp.]|uniref:AraC family transcriptional regulator n=1 Tax=Nostoc sp. TaxID=1180 RepID=UPI002FF5AFDB
MDARETNSMMPARAQGSARAWEDAFRLSREPLLSSTSVGWQDIHLEYHCQPPSEVPEHLDGEHEIYIPHFQCNQAMQWTIDGCYQQRQMGRGEVAIIPAHVSHSLSWNFDAECTIISLAPGFVSRIAYESIEPVTVELIPIFAQLDPLICQVGAALKSVLETDSVYSRLSADSAATLLAAHLLQHYSVRKGSIRTHNGGLPNYKLRRALTYIQEHLDQNLSLSVIAAEVSMSQYHFSRLFKQSMGISVHQYVIQCRVECAKQLLLQHELSVTDVAFRVGFANPSHLSHHFKRIVGVTPKTFLNQ